MELLRRRAIRMKPGRKRRSAAVGALALLVLGPGCASMNEGRKAARIDRIDALTATTLAELRETDEDFADDIERAPGYFAGRGSVTKLPLIEWGSGEGVVVDRETGERSYIKITRGGTGYGYGYRAVRFVAVFRDREALEDAFDGAWQFSAGGEASAGSQSADASSSDVVKRYRAFLIADQGASATATVRVTKYKPFAKVEGGEAPADGAARGNE